MIDCQMVKSNSDKLAEVISLTFLLDELKNYTKKENELRKQLADLMKDSQMRNSGVYLACQHKAEHVHCYIRGLETVIDELDGRRKGYF